MHLPLRIISGALLLGGFIMVGWSAYHAYKVDGLSTPIALCGLLMFKVSDMLFRLCQ